MLRNGPDRLLWLGHPFHRPAKTPPFPPSQTEPWTFQMGWLWWHMCQCLQKYQIVIFYNIIRNKLVISRLQVRSRVSNFIMRHIRTDTAPMLWKLPVESRPRSWLWIRWTLSLAAISLPFSMPALDRREPDDWGCILVADAYFSSITDGRPCSVVLGVSSTIPLEGTKANVSLYLAATGNQMVQWQNARQSYIIQKRV